MPPPIFFANNAEAILIPSPPKDARSADRMLNNTKARMAPDNVPNEAMTKDPRREPHCTSAVPRRLVPRRSSGVARVREMDWRKVLAVEPPGGNSVLHVNDSGDDDGDDSSGIGIHPTLDAANVSAMAVTGAPSSFPINVVLPISWAREAAKERTAMFPQLFEDEIIEDDGEAAESAVLDNGLDIVLIPLCRDV